LCCHHMNVLATQLLIVKNSLEELVSVARAWGSWHLCKLVHCG
jgi:hypothetical protein